MIQVNIARLESQIIVAMDEKQIHEEDLQFYLQLLQELGGFESESEEVEGTTDISHAEIPNPAIFTAEKELRDHVYYCTVRLPWCESYPQSCVKKRVKMTTWS